MRKVVVPLVVLLLSLTATHAATYGFKNITHNNASAAAIGEAQIQMEVSRAGTFWVGEQQYEQVAFKFINSGLNACSITDIYFDDGTLLEIAGITASSGVQFGIVATPGNLPGGKLYDFNPEYNDNPEARFSADSEAPVVPNGVNPGEWVSIVYTLQPSKDLNAVIAALALGNGAEYDITGALRVGVKVQGFGNGASEGFLNGGLVPQTGGSLPPVPEVTTTAGLLGLAFLGLAGFRRRSA